MNQDTLNYSVFFILLFIIIYLGCFNRNALDKLFGFKENFNDKAFDVPVSPNVYSNRNKYDDLEGTHYKIAVPLVPRIYEEKEGWKQMYKKDLGKGNVNYTDNFGGVVTRNYLDNMNFFLN